MKNALGIRRKESRVYGGLRLAPHWRFSVYMMHVPLFPHRASAILIPEGVLSLGGGKGGYLL